MANVIILNATVILDVDYLSLFDMVDGFVRCYLTKIAYNTIKEKSNLIIYIVFI